MNSPMRTTLIVTSVLLGLLFISSSAMNRSFQGSGMMRDWYNKGESVTSSSTGSVGMMDGGMMAPSWALTDNSYTDTSTSLDQKVIKNGSVDMTAADVTKTTTALTALAEEKKGYIQSSSVSEDAQGLQSAYVVVRVPVDAFTQTMTDIQALGTHINSASTSGDDVTQTYTDLQARLTAAQAQEAQYLTILKSATSVGDVLAVQEHLADVRATIESLQGQITYLANQTDLATISVSITEEATPESATQGKFDPARDANAAIAMVITLGQQGLTLLIWALIFGVAIGIPVVIIFFAVKAVLRRRDGAKRRR